MWAEACGQIFFSLGICMGTMTSYSSFNPRNKPIIGDGIKIALTNALISFIAGFACFSVVGYLVERDSPVSDKVASIGLAFVAYPAAIETMTYPNFWAVILGITLFTLGIDSSFSMLEAVSTVMSDAYMFRDMPRKLLALILCVIGAISSIFFSYNWGFTYFDVVDHFLNVYLMLLIGILETAGVGWVYEAIEICEKGGDKVKLAVIIWAATYWGSLIITGFITFFIFAKFAPSLVFFGPLIFIFCCIVGWLVSVSVSGLGFKQWHKTIAMGGVRKLARYLTKLSKEVGNNTQEWWEDPFEMYWGFTIKYWCPFAIFQLFMFSFLKDTESPYGGYHVFWQWMGYVYPAGGFLAFIIPVFTCTEKDPLNDLEDTAFDENDRVGTGVKDIYELMSKAKKEGKSGHENDLELTATAKQKQVDEGNDEKPVAQLTPAVNDEAAAE